MHPGFSCNYCLRAFPVAEALRRHHGQPGLCRTQHQLALRNLRNPSWVPLPSPSVEPNQPLSLEPDTPMDIDTPAGDPNDTGPEAGFEEEEVEACRPTVSVEEVEDEEDGYYVQDFPSMHQAGAKLHAAPTLFQTIRDNQVLQGAEVLGPFESEEEWELAKWLIKNVGHTQAETFLKLPIVRNSFIIGLLVADRIQDSTTCQPYIFNER